MAQTGMANHFSDPERESVASYGGLAAGGSGAPGQEVKSPPQSTNNMGMAMMAESGAAETEAMHGATNEGEEFVTQADAFSAARGDGAPRETGTEDGVAAESDIARDTRDNVSAAGAAMPLRQAAATTSVSHGMAMTRDAQVSARTPPLPHCHLGLSLPLRPCTV